MLEGLPRQPGGSREECTALTFRAFESEFEEEAQPQTAVPLQRYSDELGFPARQVQMQLQTHGSLMPSQKAGASSPAAKDLDDNEPLLVVLGRAVYNEVIAPIFRLPGKLGTKTLTRMHQSSTSKSDGFLSRSFWESMEMSLYDEVCNQPMRFMPTELPHALIDRNVTRVQLDPRAPLRYIEEFDVVGVLGEGSTGKVLHVQQVNTEGAHKDFALKVLLARMQHG